MVFLCPCGDRPHEMKPLIALFTYYNESETYGLEVSPPARGWSFPRPRPEPLGQGFPARAGMVLGKKPALYTGSRFPRPAGMVPAHRVGPLEQRRFPRPRGDG